MSKKDAILVFDSGIGGLSILSALKELLPHEEFIYYGDSKNAPYGDKTKEEIIKLTLDAIDPFIQQGVKAVVIACNTATSAATTLRAKYDLPIIGVEPAIKQAVQDFPNGKILVMATAATLQLEKFQQLKKDLNSPAEILQKPCPGLVELIEEKPQDNSKIQAYLQENLKDYQGIDAVVLGCTHYPLIRDQIQGIFPQAKLYDSALGTARELQRQLSRLSQ